MKTDDLVALLAADALPVRRHAARGQLALALAAALPVAVAVMATGYGVRAGFVASLADPMAWIKILLPAAVSVTAFVTLERLARPGVRLRAAWTGMLLPVVLLWVLGLAVWLTAAPENRAELFWGRTWRTCAFSITALAAPMFVGAFVALRHLAPTRPALAGAVAGAMSSGAGAAVYALHCPELGAPFLAVWYVIGMAVPVVAGAALGPRLLRW